MGIGKILRAVGKGAAIAAEFTPAGAAVTKGLNVAGKVLNTPDTDQPDTCREIAVQAVIANLGLIVQANEQQRPLSAYLDDVTDSVEAWLVNEAAAASRAAGEGK